LLDYSASIEGIFIPNAWVRSAVDLELPSSGPIIAGLDIGEEGDDASVFIPRQGPRVLEIVSWGGCTTHTTAHRAVDECRDRGVKLLHYDAVGVGTGPKGIWRAMEESGDLPFTAVPLLIRNDRGKIGREGKKAMKSRGITPFDWPAPSTQVLGCNSLLRFQKETIMTARRIFLALAAIVSLRDSSPRPQHTALPARMDPSLRSDLRRNAFGRNAHGILSANQEIRLLVVAAHGKGARAGLPHLGQSDGPNDPALQVSRRSLTAAGD
jgi:hypothetical protein